MKKVFVLLVGFMLLSSVALAGEGQFPEIINTTLTLADTEYSQAITGVKKFTIQARTNSAVRFSYTTGKVATPTAPYITIKAGSVFWEDDVIVNKTLYFATDDAGTVVEILVYR